jgi:hypothetical protein
MNSAATASGRVTLKRAREGDDTPEEAAKRTRRVTFHIPPDLGSAPSAEAFFGTMEVPDMPILASDITEDAPTQDDPATFDGTLPDEVDVIGDDEETIASDDEDDPQSDEGNASSVSAEEHVPEEFASASASVSASASASAPARTSASSSSQFADAEPLTEPTEAPPAAPAYPSEPRMRRHETYRAGVFPEERGDFHLQDMLPERYMVQLAAHEIDPKPEIARLMARGMIAEALEHPKITPENLPLVVTVDIVRRLVGIKLFGASHTRIPYNLLTICPRLSMENCVYIDRSLKDHGLSSLFVSSNCLTSKAHAELPRGVNPPSRAPLDDLRMAMLLCMELPDAARMALERLGTTLGEGSLLDQIERVVLVHV